jgi:pyridoxamine 5'-phosphate oxidase
VSDLYAVPRLPKQLPNDPMPWVRDWLDEAFAKKVQRNPHAVTCVTVNPEGQPSGRMVLCKEIVVDPGYFVFYTNYRSDKAQHIEANPNVALVFHWDALGRQVRIEGEAVRSPAEESDAYFASRDWGSQLGAWGSDQSAPLESRRALLAQVRDRALKLGIDAARNLDSIAAADRKVIPRPPHWGGYRVWARRAELWIEGKSRVHDRARWERSLAREGVDRFVTGDWSGTRLQP